MSSSKSLGSSLRRAGALGVIAAAGLAGQAGAATFTENGDAGQTVASAQDTSSSGPLQALTGISGSISSSTDADLYLIHIADPLSFVASATAAGTSMFDPQLFLLTLNGAPVALNDDAAGGVDTLPTLGGINGLTAGFYLLGVSQSGYDPVNSVNQLLFAAGLPTDTRYPASGLQPAVLGGFSDGTFFADSGSYALQLSGVDTLSVSAVPEPSTLMLFAAGGLLAALRRRRA